MFDSPLPVRLARVQRNKNNVESYGRQYIYTFFIKDKFRSIKYIASIKAYSSNLLTIDFYPKIHAQDRYRILTNQFKFGRIGSTVLFIMSEVQKITGKCSFGILSASLFNEVDNLANKRYEVYTKVLQRKVNPAEYMVAGVPENSYIFIIPINTANDLKGIYLHYEQIFRETS